MKINSKLRKDFWRKIKKTISIWRPIWRPSSEKILEKEYQIFQDGYIKGYKEGSRTKLNQD